MKRKPAVLITYGGSHRSRREHLRALRELGIVTIDAGPVNLNSKRRHAIILEDDLAAARSVKGVARSRIQWSWLKDGHHGLENETSL